MQPLQFIKNWALPIAMLTGILSYFVYVNIPALNGTHAFMNQFISYLQPLLIFCMLYVSFCKINPRDLKPHKWMLKPLTIQIASFAVMALIIIISPTIKGRVIIESAMICMICPTATAAAVVTSKLHGNASAVVSYTCIINLACSIAIPTLIPFIHEQNSPGMDFQTSFLLIIGKVFPLLILPLAAAWLTRHLTPKFHRKIQEKKDLAFNLWAVALALAIAVTVKAIMHSNESIINLVGIAIVSLVCCIVQFICGRIIGRHHNEPIAGAQCLGQKNTVFAIWMGYTFMNPVTAMAGGFYSIWHNTVNTYQLWAEREKDKKQTN